MDRSARNRERDWTDALDARSAPEGLSDAISVSEISRGILAWRRGEDEKGEGKRQRAKGKRQKAKGRCASRALLTEIGRDTSELQSQFHIVCRLLLEKK